MTLVDYDSPRSSPPSRNYRYRVYYIRIIADAN